MKRFFLLPLLAAGFILAGCTDSVVNVSDDAAAKKADESGFNLVNAAIAYNGTTGAFDLLIHAVTRPEQAAVLGVLNNKGQHTVFAPTDDAFLAFLSAVTGSWVTDEEVAKTIISGLDANTLTRVLTYHVANGRRYSGDVVESDQIRMLNGEFASVEVMADPLTVKIDGEELVLSLIDLDEMPTGERITNGIIHVVSGVLNPLN